MPLSVSNATPTTVLPYFLCRSFTHNRSYLVDQTAYPDGSRQSRLLVTSSQKSWGLVASCTPAILSALSAFYLARKGPTEPFYFYDLTVTGAIYDPSGIAVTGRHVVHFTTDYQQRLQVGKSEADFSIIELA